MAMAPSQAETAPGEERNPLASTTPPPRHRGRAQAGCRSAGPHPARRGTPPSASGRRGSAAASSPQLSDLRRGTPRPEGDNGRWSARRLGPRSVSPRLRGDDDAVAPGSRESPVTRVCDALSPGQGQRGPPGADSASFLWIHHRIQTRLHGQPAFRKQRFLSLSRE